MQHYLWSGYLYFSATVYSYSGKKLMIQSMSYLQPMPAQISYSLLRGRRVYWDCVLGVQTRSGPPVFLVPFFKDLARMHGTSQPNQKWMQGIKPWYLEHKPQPLTIDWMMKSDGINSKWILNYGWVVPSWCRWGQLPSIMDNVWYIGNIGRVCKLDQGCAEIIDRRRKGVGPLSFVVQKN